MSSSILPRRTWATRLDQDDAEALLAAPTDEDCNALLEAMEDLGHTRWATATHLVHRSGLRRGELIALQAHDLGVRVDANIAAMAVTDAWCARSRSKIPSLENQKHPSPRRRGRLVE